MSSDEWGVILVVILVLGICVILSATITLGNFLSKMEPTADELSIEYIKEQNYAKCLAICSYESNETIGKMSKAYCVQQCKR